MPEAGGLWVLIPARNEENRIEAVIRRVRAALPNARILVVDSDSQDETARRAEAAGARVVAQGFAGYAGALQAGYSALLPERPAAVVQLDADGQHPPEESPRLLAALAGADWVIGSRQGTRSPGPRARRLGNALLRLSVLATTGRWLGDVTSGMQALGPAALAAFAARFPCCHADAAARVRGLRDGLRVVEVPVAMTERAGGASMHDGLRGLRNFGGSLVAVLEESLR